MKSDAGRAAALGVLLLFVALRACDPAPIETTRLRGFDWMQWLWPRAYAPAPVRIVAIDEASLAAHGQWPWPRALLAKLVEKIAAAEPTAVALDMVLVEPDRFSPQRLAETLPDLSDELAAALRRLPNGDAALATALRGAPAVLGLGASFDADPSLHGPLRLSPVVAEGADPLPFLPSYPALLTSLAELREAERGRGSLVATIDRDGVLRSVPLFVAAEGKLVPSLSADAVRVAVGGNHRLRVGRFGIRSAEIAGHDAPVDAHGRTYLHFAAAFDTRYVSATALLQGTADPQALRGTIVVVGVTALGIVDVKQTPLGAMHGVEVQAQLAESLLSGTLLRRPWYVGAVELALVLFAGLVVLALPQRRAALSAAGLAALVIALVGVELAAFRLGRWLLDGAYPALAAIGTFGVLVSASLRAAERARRRLAEELQHEREAKARLEGELSTARAIQMGLLPHPPERDDVETSALVEPARSVGGDLYDLLMLDDHRLFFMIADVAGKGVPAALFMASCKEVMRSAAFRHGQALDRLFAEASAKIAVASNDMVVEGAGAMFVTVRAAVLDLASGALVHACAGHGAAYLLRAGLPPIALDGVGGPPLGTVDDFPYTVESYYLSPGDLVMLYTDGVPEAENRSRAFYGSERLQSVLAKLPVTSAKEAVEGLRADVRRLVADAEAADDIALLAVRWVSAR